LGKEYKSGKGREFFSAMEIFSLQNHPTQPEINREGFSILIISNASNINGSGL
jgi:hypothetical protein